VEEGEALTDTVLYTEEYQVKVLAYMLANSSFREIAGETIDHSHFANRALQWYFTTIKTAPIALTPTTLREELIKAAKTKVIREAEVEKVASYYSFVSKPPLPAEEQHIQDTFSKFIRTQSMKQAILDSLDLIKEERWDEVVQIVEQARNTGMDVLTVGTNYFKEYEERLANRLVREEARKLSTGIAELDEYTFGGLKTKQMGLLIGGSGRGKSIALEWLARVAILLGHQVVYYTLELSAEDIADRFDSLFCHIKPNELKSMNDSAFKQLHGYHQRFGNNLIIKEYPEDEATIHTIKAHYKQLASIGVTPGLVIIDYLDLMKPHRTYHDVNQEQAAVAKATRGMAKEYNTRVWSALQLNRAGMAMETADETGIGGSISRLYTADLCIILAQTKDEKEDSVMRLFINKNRNGPALRQVKIATDFGHMQFYSGPAKDTALQSGQANATIPDTGDGGEELAHVPEEVVAGDVVLD
jgi:replicative DNA helicase